VDAQAPRGPGVLRPEPSRGAGRLGPEFCKSGLKVAFFESANIAASISLLGREFF
jgi:hypothetical protein